MLRKLVKVGLFDGIKENDYAEDSGNPEPLPSGYSYQLSSKNRVVEWLIPALRRYVVPRAITISVTAVSASALSRQKSALPLSLTVEPPNRKLERYTEKCGASNRKSGFFSWSVTAGVENYLRSFFTSSR
jgi:hypothetical protein